MTDENSMPEENPMGFRILGRITGVKGTCYAGHKVGDELEVSGISSGGLCGFFYHDIFPYIVMLQYGGNFPLNWGDPNLVELECIDKENAVRVELRRIRD